MTCHFARPVSVWWWGDEVTMQVLHQAKRDLQKEMIRSPLTEPP